MDTTEHKLMISMFGSLIGMHLLLVETLRKRGLLTEQEARGISELAGWTGAGMRNLISDTRVFYTGAAKILGLEIADLDNEQSEGPKK